MNCIFLVFGDEVKKDFSNLSTIDTKVVPNIGEDINIKKGIFKVIIKVVDYRQVEDYSLESKERGGEIVYIFIK